MNWPHTTKTDHGSVTANVASGWRKHQEHATAKQSAFLCHSSPQASLPLADCQIRARLCLLNSFNVSALNSGPISEVAVLGIWMLLRVLQHIAQISHQYG